MKYLLTLLKRFWYKIIDLGKREEEIKNAPHENKNEYIIKEERQGSSSNKETDKGNRNIFQWDSDKILFSPNFRRLQGKTQVFPLADHAHIRNRYSHTIETASISRSFGYLLSKHLGEDSNPNKERHKISDILVAAALAHDIGNPPFGHAGEEAISSWFKNNKDKLKGYELSEDEIKDLQCFDGNAQSFRILTKKKTYRKDSLGFQISYSTLGAMMKYPWMANENNCSSNKFGAFLSEKTEINEVREALKMKTPPLGSPNNYMPLHIRYPFAYLVEAADDICNSIVDIEDGITLDLLEAKEVFNVVESILSDENKTLFKNLKGCNKGDFLKSKVIKSFIYPIFSIYKTHHRDLATPLVELLEGKYGKTYKNLSKMNKDLFRDKKIVQLEMAGTKIIHGLFDTFINKNILLNDSLEDLKKEGCFTILPSSIQLMMEETKGSYDRCRLIIDYISGLTDADALRLYRRLKGFEVPSFC